MKPMKVGQRVAVYGWDGARCFWNGESATVVDFVKGESGEVFINDNREPYKVVVHRRQCVPLKPKRKRREWTGVWSHHGKQGFCFFPNGPYEAELIGAPMTLRESPRKKRQGGACK